MLKVCWNALRASAAALLVSLLCLSGASAQSGSPIKIGIGLALTGAGASPSKVIQTALEIWRDDVNAKGGILGRPVQLIILDDQSNPANVPGVYTKLITVDKVDLLLGPYGTNFVAPAIPTIMQHNKLTISFTAIGINRHFNYDKYFSMVSVGPDGVNAFSRGFFELAAQQKPRPQTVAILAADAEFARSAADGAREELKKHGFKVVYDQSYPPPTTDFAPVMRAIQAANPDIVYIGAYPPDNVGIIRAANEIGLSPKMFGGAMIGMLVTPIKVQLGPIANGLIVSENFAAAGVHNFTGTADFLKRYSAKATAAGIDPLGFAWGPFAYAAGQVLDKAVTGTKSLDHNKLADYMHKTKFETVAGNFSFAKDGEWSQTRQVWTQVQNAQPNNLEQFRDGKAQPILWPPEMKTGNLIYPYADARKK
ncbi:MAG TPA: amino acid ABC transporter substrate-binding protein [Pirellulales bacterium]|nr:amino acid ABC transporter substrate-binding protein [Pirellulales bacterium]